MRHIPFISRRRPVFAPRQPSGRSAGLEAAQPTTPSRFRWSGPATPAAAAGGDPADDAPLTSPSINPSAVLQVRPLVLVQQRLDKMMLKAEAWLGQSSGIHLGTVEEKMTP